MTDSYWQHNAYRPRGPRDAYPRDAYRVYVTPGQAGDIDDVAGPRGPRDAYRVCVTPGQTDGIDDVAENRNGVDSANVAPDEPLESGVAGAYWRGSYRMQGPAESPQAHHAGSVSARARQAYAAEALRQKDHVVAGLLAIFLGMFGVHKFYLGCNQTGFLMLAVSIIGGIITFGLAAAVIEVIAIIEGVIYLSKSQTEFDRTYVLSQRDWF